MIIRIIYANLIQGTDFLDFCYELFMIWEICVIDI